MFSLQAAISESFENKAESHVLRMSCFTLHLPSEPRNSLDCVYNSAQVTIQIEVGWKHYASSICGCSIIMFVFVCPWLQRLERVIEH